jgi:hypothetical protein
VSEIVETFGRSLTRDELRQFGDKGQVSSSPSTR